MPHTKMRVQLMDDYAFQLKLHTLANCAVIENQSYDTFTFEGINFTHWEFNHSRGYQPGAWLITSETKAKDFQEAYNNFFTTLNDIIPKIAMISQCHTEYLDGSFVIHRRRDNIAFFRYTKETDGVSLYFDKESLDNLSKLKAANLPNEFFYYWNDMLNAPNYPAKLLLICSALEALAKGLKEKKHPFAKTVLGEDLYKKVYQDKNKGIRHRLVHGDYFSEIDKEDYVSQIYDQIIQYFNQHFFQQTPIKNVEEPQRHPWGNRVQASYFLKNTLNASFDLKAMIETCNESLTSLTKSFEILDETQIERLRSNE